MNSPARPVALRLALVYVAVSGAWILLSDRLLAWLTGDPLLLTRLQTLKGWGFVLCSGVLIYVLVRRALAAVGRRDEQVQSAERALRQSEASLRLQSAALEAADDAIAIADRDGRIEWANSAFARLTGYAADEASGMSLLAPRPNGRETDADRRIRERVLSGRPWHGEVVASRKDGSSYVEEQTVTPVRDETGAVGHLVAIKRDVTARRERAAGLGVFARSTAKAHVVRTLGRAGGKRVGNLHAGERAEVLGNGRRKLQPGVRLGMAKPQPPGVQHVPLRAQPARCGLTPFSSPAVGCVSQDRMAEVREVHPDLVRAAGFESRLHECHVGEPAQDAIRRARLAPAPLAHAHARSIALPPPDRDVDPPRVAPHDAVHQRQVPLPDDPVLELPAERSVRRLALGDHHDPGRLPIQAVDDARPFHPADARKVSTMREQGVHERACGPAGAGMHDEPGGLVEDQYVRVLPQDVEGDRLGRQGEGFGVGDDERDPLAGPDGMSRLLRAAVHEGIRALDQILYARSREAADPGKKRIQPLPGVRRLDGEEAQVRHGSDRQSAFGFQQSAISSQLSGKRSGSVADR